MSCPWDRLSWDTCQLTWKMGEKWWIVWERWRWITKVSKVWLKFSYDCHANIDVSWCFGAEGGSLPHGAGSAGEATRCGEIQRWVDHDTWAFLEFQRNHGQTWIDTVNVNVDVVFQSKDLTSRKGFSVLGSVGISLWMLCLQRDIDPSTLPRYNHATLLPREVMSEQDRSLLRDAVSRVFTGLMRCTSEMLCSGWLPWWLSVTTKSTS